MTLVDILRQTESFLKKNTADLKQIVKWQKYRHQNIYCAFTIQLQLHCASTIEGNLCFYTI